jgi:DNA-binding transcriptional ArsR family regulator
MAAMIVSLFLSVQYIIHMLTIGFSYMTPTQLRAFHLVAEAGSFSAAARASGLSQPNLSGQVTALEKAYGVHLFDRRGRTVTPTETGRQLHGVTTRLFALQDEAQALLLGEQALTRGHLRIAADSAHHVPIQRMPNVSLQPGTEDLSTGDLISRVTDGIYIVGDKSWSIDMQRYNFQFTGQRFFRIRNGRLDGQLRDVAYQAVTTDFWNSMEAVGGASTWRLGGAFNCGKAQPGQVAAVSHGCPSALFRGVNVLNTRAESGR